MQEFSQQDDGADAPSCSWQPCCPGEISKLNRNRGITRRQMLFGGGAAALLLAGVVTRNLVLRNLKLPTYAMLCSEVQPQLRSFADGTIRDRQLFASIAVHLKDCNTCTSALNELV